jgi:hypothetical protein
MNLHIWMRPLCVNLRATPRLSRSRFRKPSMSSCTSFRAEREGLFFVHVYAPGIPKSCMSVYHCISAIPATTIYNALHLPELSLNRIPGRIGNPFFVLLRVHICRDSDTPKVRVTGSVSTSTSGAGVVPGPRQTGTGSARYCHIFIRFIPCLCSLQEEGSSASCQHQPMLPERNSCGKLLPRIEIVSL